MDDNGEKIDLLLDKLEKLLTRQDGFNREIRLLQAEITQLKHGPPKQAPVKTTPLTEERPPLTARTEPMEGKTTVPPQTAGSLHRHPEQPNNLQEPGWPPAAKPPGRKSDFEKFIGENLINKIGIAITVIGVAIGAKYSIEQELISPLTRIVLGYLAGLGLLAFGIMLKQKYAQFSAVLVSGAMAILYFITYAAYDFYGLIPQAVAFGMMVVFTGFTVLASLAYNNQVIAQLGLVGAYAVPFLLSNNSGNVAALFTYMAIINAGILFLSFKKYWKPLYYAAFVLTWLIYLAWYWTGYESAHFGLALGFSAIFFVTFYLTFIGYKLRKTEIFDTGDVILLLGNAFIYYSAGYAVLSRHTAGAELLGLFTLGNAVAHFAVAATINRQKLADKNFFYLAAGLVLVFVTIAVPVQLDGNWVTLLWAGEAALLFWIGRGKAVPIYEKLAYPLMVLAFASLVHDWGNAYANVEGRSPLLNTGFLTSMMFAGALGFIATLNHRHPQKAVWGGGFANNLGLAVTAVFLLVLYVAFRLEIEVYWQQRYTASLVLVNTPEGYPNEYYDYSLLSFKIIWVLNYTLLFVALVSFVNILKLKNRYLGMVSLWLNVLAIAVFLIQGLLELGSLRDMHTGQSLSEHYQSSGFYIGIRYVSFVFVALVLLACQRYTRQDFLQQDIKTVFDLLLHITLLWLATNELLTWLTISQAAQTDKLGVSILWGAYSLLLIVLGIWKKKKHLRLGAMLLFGTTLLKLFLYDLADLDTLAKTIVFVSLGILLLIISFLYNKYKHIIADETES